MKDEERIMKNFCFTVDDNIRFFRELNETRPASVFDHPYLAMYRRLHEKYNLKVQLNLFYREGDFDLTQMTDAYRQQWQENANWLKMSFHSQWENVKPYEFSGYQEVYDHCKAVNDQILRFAVPDSLGKTTTVHYCRTTNEGLDAMGDNGYQGLLGLFGTPAEPRCSYSAPEELCRDIRMGKLLPYRGVQMAPIDIVLNIYSVESILSQLEAMKDRPQINVMIHEQYFYPDYRAYQPEFAQKLEATFTWLCDHGYQSRFLEECI